MSTPHRYTEQSPHIATAAFRTRSAVFGITDTLDVVERDAEVSELVRERCLSGHCRLLVLPIRVALTHLQKEISSPPQLARTALVVTFDLYPGVHPDDDIHALYLQV